MSDRTKKDKRNDQNKTSLLRDDFFKTLTVKNKKMFF
jgi:hypothetical protein